MTKLFASSVSEFCKSISAVLISTTPLIPSLELAVMSLFGERKSPWVLILILPPLPSKALAIISLFSRAANVSVSMVMLPPLPVPPAVAVK